MKNLFKLFLVITLGLTVSACSKTDDVKEEDEKEVVEEVVDEDYVRGVWTDNVYTNEFVGLDFTMPEGWTLATNEELLSMLDSSNEQFLDEEAKKNYEKAIEQASTFYDFAIFNLTTGENMIMNIEDLSKNGAAILITEDQFLDVVEEQILNIEGIEYEVVDRSDVRFANEDYRKLELSANGVMTQEYYTKKFGKYMVSIVVSYVTSSPDAITALIEEINQ
ncbi:MAG TPA: hypothetical protein VFH18_03695 [Erysipelotrichaceae bacterium]|nr:hypothetical protein [Erysipelotrichaceae bacterium]